MNPPKTTPRRKIKNTNQKFSLSFVETDIKLSHPLKPMERAEASQNLSESDTDEKTPRRSLRVKAKSQLNATLDLSEMNLFKTPANGTSNKKSKRATFAAALAPISGTQTPTKSVKKSMSKTKENIETIDDGLNISSASKKSAKRVSLKKVADEAPSNENNAETEANGLNTTFEKDSTLLDQANDATVKNDSEEHASPESDAGGATCLGYFGTITDDVNKKIDSNSFTIETESNEANEHLSPRNNNKKSDSLLTEDNDNSITVGNTEQNHEVDQDVQDDNNISGIAALTDDDDNADSGAKVNEELKSRVPVRVSVIDLTDSPAVKPATNLNKTFSPSPRAKRQQIKENPIKSGMVQKSRGGIKKVISSAKKQRIIENAKEIVEEKRKKVEFQDTETKLGSAIKFKKTPFKGENAAMVLPWSGVNKIPTMQEIQNQKNKKKILKTNENVPTPSKSQNGATTPGSKRAKLPDFSQIHNKLFEKMESIDETLQRQTERAKNLMSGKKPMLNKPEPNTSAKLKNPTNLESRLNKTESDNVLQERSNVRAKIVKPIFGRARNEKIEEREERRKQMFKSRPAGRNGVSSQIIKGVRQNRRFELLMANRQAKDK